MQQEGLDDISNLVSEQCSYQMDYHIELLATKVDRLRGENYTHTIIGSRIFVLNIKAYTRCHVHITLGMNIISSRGFGYLVRKFISSD